MVKLIKNGFDAEIEVDEKSLLSCLTASTKNTSIVTYYENLPQVISTLRKVGDKTTAEIADELNDHQPNISNFEHGKRSFNFSNLGKILGAMGYKYSILIEKDGDSASEDDSTPKDSDIDTNALTPPELRYDFLTSLKRSVV